MMSAWPSRVVLIGALLAAALATERLRDRAQSHFIATQTYEDVYYLPPPDQLVMGSLGYRELLADLIWMKALIYFGSEIVHRGGVKNLYAYTDAMLALDPHFKKVYRWVASAAIYRTGDVTNDDIRKAIAYLERGITVFPDDGDLAWDLGATYAYELAPMLVGDDERAEARRHGLVYLQLAALRGAGPAWLALSAAGQLSRLGKTEQAIKHLQDVYATISDDSMKQQVLARLGQLRNASYAEAFQRTAQELEAARMKNFPYVDPSLFMLLGKRPPFDATALLLRGFDPQADPQGLSDGRAQD